MAYISFLCLPYFLNISSITQYIVHCKLGYYIHFTSLLCSVVQEMFSSVSLLTKAVVCRLEFRVYLMVVVVVFFQQSTASYSRKDSMLKQVNETWAKYIYYFSFFPPYLFVLFVCFPAVSFQCNKTISGLRLVPTDHQCRDKRALHFLTRFYSATKSKNTGVFFFSLVCICANLSLYAMVQSFSDMNWGWSHFQKKVSLVKVAHPKLSSLYLQSLSHVT